MRIGRRPASSLAASAGRVLDRYLNVLPTITIREGLSHQGLSDQRPPVAGVCRRHRPEVSDEASSHARDRGAARRRDARRPRHRRARRAYDYLVYDDANWYRGGAAALSSCMSSSGSCCGRRNACRSTWRRAITAIPSTGRSTTSTRARCTPSGFSTRSTPAIRRGRLPAGRRSARPARPTSSAGMPREPAAAAHERVRAPSRLADSVSRLAVDQTGRHARRGAAQRCRSSKDMENDAVSTVDDFHTQTALLNKINAATVLGPAAAGPHQPVPA